MKTTQLADKLPDLRDLRRRMPFVVRRPEVPRLPVQDAPDLREVDVADVPVDRIGAVQLRLAPLLDSGDLGAKVHVPAVNPEDFVHETRVSELGGQ